MPRLLPWLCGIIYAYNNYVGTVGLPNQRNGKPMIIEENTDLFSLPIEVLGLELRTLRVLQRGNVFTLLDIINLGESGLLKIYQLGKKQVPYVISTLNRFLQESKGKSLEEICLRNELPQFESLDEFKHQPISILCLSGRTINPLIRSHINSIGELLESRLSSYKSIKGIGVKACQEIDMALTKFSLEPIIPDDTRTRLYEVETKKPNLINEIVPFTKALMQILNHEREFEVLKLRYGLEGSNSYTLQEIGDFYGISRERVRQIEEQAKTNIKKYITGAFSDSKWLVPKNITNEAIDLINALQGLGDFFTEAEVVIFLQKRYIFEFHNNDLGEVRLWLELAGLEELPKATANNMSRIFVEPAWISPDKIDKKVLYDVISVIYHSLLEEIKPITRFELVVEVNRKLKKKIDPQYFEYTTRICPDIEILNDNSYQLSLKSLPSAGDKAYRVLYEANKPLHLREILREINYQQVKAGASANVHSRSLQQQLVMSNKIEPIGRSGEWSLVNWKHVSKDSILELMQEFLHLKQTAVTAKDIYEYVHSKRDSVKLISVQTYLVDQKSIFTRVDSGRYGLTVWGIKEFEPKRSRISSSELDSEIDAAIKSVFVDEKTDRLPLWLTVEKVKKKTGRAIVTIRKRMSEAPYLEIEPHPTHPNRRFLICLRGEQEGASQKTGKKEGKILIRDNVQNEIRIFLQKTTNQSAPLAVIASHVIKKTGCLKSTFYRYMSEMENIRKEYEGNVLVCKLVGEPQADAPLSFPQIDSIGDVELKDNLLRAINNLNLDHVDSGLFQLGKIFETELKEFLIHAKSKNAFPVSNNDLDRLANMIDCIVRNKIITQVNHLSLLREHRNERAHGHIPNLLERQKLMQYAPFLGDLYINYIILINEKRLKL